MPSYPDLKLYVGGEWRSRDGAPVINPADESILGTVPHATRADLDDTLAAAEQGFRVWRNMSPAKRAEIIQRAAQLCRERGDEDAVAMTLEQGKPVAQAKLEILRGCDIIDWDATEGRRVYGRVIPSEPGMARNVDQLADRVEVGNLSINHLTASFAETPFGGVKDSGYGREGGTEGLECYTVAKNVSHLVL